jgi:hypothetical protein|uniref:Uncharacterized protein n=1 Tax=uncultured bacterium Ad_139_A06_contig1 TaxID=1489303 RepID=A0A0B4N162_9BACT|nr:putative hypothetical protein Fisuc_2007 [uncultured bacterium Ad_139_A06_contig1]
MAKILFFCAFAGPAIALDRFLGYCDVSYSSCVLMSLALIILSFGQKILNRYFPLSLWTVFWGLVGFMGVLTFMCTAKVGVYITYALVPMVSLFYCEKKIYLISVALNYVMILVSNVLVSDFRSLVRSDFHEPLDWFIAVMGGYTIESIAIGMAGYYLCNRISNHFRSIYTSNIVLDQKYRDEEHKDRVTRAITSLYQCVYVVDLKNDTYEVVQRDPFVSDVVRDEDNLATNIERAVFALVETKDKLQMLEFLDLKTLPARLDQHSLIFAECQGKLHGRVQLSFILVERDEEGRPASVVFTLRQVA